jgi:hypothetical protein
MLYIDISFVTYFQTCKIIFSDVDLYVWYRYRPTNNLQVDYVFLVMQKFACCKDYYDLERNQRRNAVFSVCSSVVSLNRFRSAETLLAYILKIYVSTLYWQHCLLLLHFL